MKKISINKGSDFKIKSLYVHIPFCDHICSYCDFCKFIYDPKFEGTYLNNLKTEIDSYNISNLETIYVGGGTPTSLSINGLETLLLTLKKYSSSLKEYTFEANPESLNEEKLILLKKYGVNRLSIGVQSTDDNILKKMNRHHNFKEVCDVVKLAREIGFDNINLDLICSLPFDNDLERLKVDIDKIVSLSPEHISIYSLTISPHTLFFLNKFSEKDDGFIRKELDFIHEILSKYGYEHYEISNYCKKGKESLHNLTYWKNGKYYGVGVSSSGYIGNIRYSNTKSLSDYLSKKEIVSYREIVTKDDELTYFVMLNLRLKEGFSDTKFSGIFGFSFIHRFKRNIEIAINRGLLEIKKNRILPTYEGMMLLDTLVLILLEKDRI